MRLAGSLIKITTTLIYGERSRTMVIRIGDMFRGDVFVPSPHRGED
jgi:hypothetical protein